LFAALLVVPASAADLQVYPIRIMLDPSAPTAVLTIINRGQADTLLQLSVMAWSQESGDEKFEPTRDILANPGVFLLKGGEQQIARFALRVPQDVRERSYRIVVQEVPRQHVDMGLSTVLRLLVPVFVPTPNPTTGLAWSARPAAGGIDLTARNTGNVHVQIKSIKVTAAAGAPAEKQINVYVLPGASRTMRLAVAKSVAIGTALQIAADSDQGGFSASVRVGVAEGEPERH
jgi:fimbrial chaperone protein